MVELAIIGGGYWGICCAWLARAAGVEAVLLDDGNPAGATRNSAGICQQWWYKQEVAARRIPTGWDWQGPSLAWLDELGLVRDTGEMFFSRAKPEPRHRPDCLLVNPWEVEALIEPDRFQAARVHSLPRGWIVAGADGQEVAARKVIVTAGVWTDDLLAASGLPTVGVKPLRGRAVVLRADVPEEPVTYLPRPYTHYTLRPWRPGQARIGDTVERGGRSQLPALGEAFYRINQEVSWPEDIIEIVDGMRPVADRYVCDELAGGLVAATGGHRVGLGLAEPVARRALSLLGIGGPP